MPSPAVNARTRQQWRELGFYYDRDDASRRWRLVGSRTGLARFASLLREYAADPRHAQVSSHEHFGPYMDLEVMTWTGPRIDGHAIAGRLEDLSRLASLVADRVAVAAPGHSCRIGNDYAPGNDYDLELVVAPDDFDPASADRSCVDGSSP